MPYEGVVALVLQLAHSKPSDLASNTSAMPRCDPRGIHGPERLDSSLVVAHSSCLYKYKVNSVFCCLI